MVWLNDIWGFFLDEKDVEDACIDICTNEICFDAEDRDVLKIPRIFKRAELLREFIRNSPDRKMINLARRLDEFSDFRLLDLFHKNYSPWYDPDNYYSKWVEAGKEKIVDFAEEWCNCNNIPCTRKMISRELYTFLTAYCDENYVRF